MSSSIDNKSSTVDVTTVTQISMLNVTHLRSFASDADQALPNVRPSGKPFSEYIGDGDIVIGSIVQANAIPSDMLDCNRSVISATDVNPETTTNNNSTTTETLPTRLLSYLRAGPRKLTFHNPSTSCAAIVTCGGLCPGMNGVICSLTKTLKETYQVPEVLGIRGGWWGFHKPENLPPIELDVKKVDGVQHTGGTMLGSSRGGFDADKILKSCIEWKVNMLFVIGGDGSHRGAMAVADLAQISKIPMSVVGIPKTIDNDIGIIDRSFGFESAVAEAKIAIKSAKVEASCAPNGIGVVKLMGRDSGYIAAHSTISSHGDVDLLLIPELKIDFNVNSKTNIFNHLNNTLLKKGHAVVVLSEGAGAEHLLQESTRNSETSADGTQPKLPPIGVYMKKRIQNYFNDILKKEVTVKYIDPSYMIRSVPANAFDSMYALMLGQNAVHGAMAGYTNFSAGLCNNRSVYLPIQELLKRSPRNIRPDGRTIERVLAVTGQPLKQEGVEEQKK